MLRSGARLVPPALAAAFIVAAGACGKKSGGGLGPPCRTAARSAQILACLDGTPATGPDACLAQVGGTPCDQDRDEVDDDLEDALGLAYAPVLAMSVGAYGGDPENTWPANVTDFTAHANLIFRRTGDTGLVDASPTLDSLPDATYVSAGKKRYADRPDKSDGQYFWVCLLDTSAAARVTTSSAMLAAPNGVDLPSVVHPANGTLADSSDYFIAYPFFWAFNEFTMDEHEGDWETIALFVNRQTGAVDDFYSARHKTTDSAFVDLSLTSAIDPAAEVVSTAIVNSPSASPHGIRFWDYAGARHHAVAYVGVGSHAMYDYPGNTQIIANSSFIDHHGGDGPKLLTWTGELVPGWTTATTAATASVTMNAWNPGEEDAITLHWATFRGNWGCTPYDGVARSYPGPFGNESNPRSIYSKLWGSPPHD